MTVGLISHHASPTLNAPNGAGSTIKRTVTNGRSTFHPSHWGANQRTFHLRYRTRNGSTAIHPIRTLRGVLAMPIYRITYAIETLVFAQDPDIASKLAQDVARVEVLDAPSVRVDRVETWEPAMGFPAGWLPEDIPVSDSRT
jgi:hypothetical protein